MLVDFANAFQNKQIARCANTTTKRKGKKTPDVPRSSSAQMFDDVLNNLKAKFEK